MRITGALALVAIGCASPNDPSHLSTLKREVSWWQTSCTASGGGKGRTVAVWFRRFPVTEETVDSKEGVRRLVIDHGGLLVERGGRSTVILYGDLKQVAARAIGAYNSAVEVSILTIRGTVENGPFGVVDLICWREIESVVGSVDPTKLSGSPPKPNSPLRDMNGNVI